MLPAYLPLFSKKEERWRREDGCKQEALILTKMFHFYKTLRYYMTNENNFHFTCDTVLLTGQLRTVAPEPLV